jgi:Protein of unknown function (DUF3019)
LLGGCTIFDGLNTQARHQTKPKQYRLFGFSFVFTFLFCVSAARASALEIDEKVVFQLRPHLCLLSDREAQCDDELTAEWTSAAELSLCLYQEQEQSPLQCWTNTTSGNTKFAILLSQSTAFELRDPLTQKQHGREIFQVSYAQKKFPHARRNPWSFF